MADLFPPIDPERVVLDAPIDAVTLFEDRAIVTRRGRMTLDAGRQRLVVSSVAPVLQDVSVRAELAEGHGAVTDARVQRALRARYAQHPEVVQATDKEIDNLRRARARSADDQQRAALRYTNVCRMLGQGATELPQDVAWGLVDGSDWKKTFETLFEKSRGLLRDAVNANIEQQKIAADLVNAIRRRQRLSRQSHGVAAWIELDIHLTVGGDVEIIIEYTTPNAMWRPSHAARLDTAAKTLTFTSSAAIWQRTGEDWSGVQIVCSTARSSLGTEPPLLNDDLLTAQRKSEEVNFAAREVAVQTTGPAGNAPAAPKVALPGVDDGGEVRNLTGAHRTDVPSDGDVVFVPLFSFESPATVQHVLMAEVDPKVFLKSTQQNTAAVPILAGPVELLRDSGAVGTSEVLFVAPNATFELGFGPQDELRIARDVYRKETEPTRLDKWTHHDQTIELYLSNLGAEGRTIQITERVPVSEVEEIRIHLDDTQSTTGYVLDEQGFCTWQFDLPGDEHRKLRLKWRLSVAPDITFSL
ncbi:MAG: mucoidy inhibitor MuiA family protein [Myxococcota bacterium]